MSEPQVLITRPQPQLDDLAARLRDVGLSSIAMPAFEFEAIGDPLAPDSDWSAAERRLLLFTSPRAVEHGMRVLPPAMLADARVASVGPATSRALAAHGLEPVQAGGPAFDSEALLERIGTDLTPGAAIILTAPGGRDALRRGLEALGWSVRVEGVYRRVPLDPPAAAVTALERAGRVVIVWSSGTALEHLMAALSGEARARLRAGPAIVVSERLATLARGQGIGHVVVADAPDNAALAACCRRLAP